MASDQKKPDKKGVKTPNPQEIVDGFQKLRAEQKSLTMKLSELEVDLNEHRMVIESLKHVDENRKCFRMIGGVLVECIVKEVLPTLISNCEKLKEITEKLNEQITKKGQELNEYREKYNIRFRGLDNVKEEEASNSQATEASRGNVLVA